MRSSRTRRQVLALAGTSAAALAGCVGDGDNETDDSGTTDNGGEMPGDDENGDSADRENGGDGMESQESWQTVAVEDATTEESFTIAEFDLPVGVARIPAGARNLVVDVAPGGGTDSDFRTGSHNRV